MGDTRRPTGVHDLQRGNDTPAKTAWGALHLVADSASLEKAAASSAQKAHYSLSASSLASLIVAEGSATSSGSSSITLQTQEGLRRSRPVPVLPLHKHQDQPPALRGQKLPEGLAIRPLEVVLAFRGPEADLGPLPGAEGALSSLDPVEDAADGEDVRTNAKGLAQEHLGGDEARRPATELPALSPATRREFTGQAEVDDLQPRAGVGAVEDEVIWLQIEVDNVEGVDMLEPL